MFLVQPTVKQNARTHKPYQICSDVDQRPEHNRPWSHMVQVVEDCHEGPVCHIVQVCQIGRACL